MTKKIISILVALVLIVAAFFLGKFSVKKEEPAALDETPILEPSEEIETISEYMSHESYRELYTAIDYGDLVTYVIGHKSPDADTVLSAIAMSNLLNELGIKAEPRIAGELNNETAYVMEKFGFNVPEILENADGCQLWLVDHSEYTQAVDGAESARIVGITDHHGVGNVGNEEQIIVRSGKYGSTTAEIFALYKECGVEISADMAKVMLFGVMSDTSYFKHDDNAVNREVYNELLKISKIDNIDEIKEGMIEAKLDLSGKTEEEIFLSDYKEYEENGVKYGICNLKVASTDKIDGMVSRMKAVADEKIKSDECEFIFYYIYDFDYEKGILGCVGTDAEKAAKLLSDGFSDEYEVTESMVVTIPSVSRKEVLVPRINGVLNAE